MRGFSKYSKRDLNPHSHSWPRDFKSLVSTDSTIRAIGAENETRTRDPNLGKVVLYQLSYFRNTVVVFQQRCICISPNAVQK